MPSRTSKEANNIAASFLRLLINSVWQPSVRKMCPYPHEATLRSKPEMSVKVASVESNGVGWVNAWENVG